MLKIPMRKKMSYFKRTAPITKSNTKEQGGSTQRQSRSKHLKNKRRPAKQRNSAATALGRQARRSSWRILPTVSFVSDQIRSTCGGQCPVRSHHTRLSRS